MKRVGAELTRMSISLTPENHKYLKTMARANGVTGAAYINQLLADERLRNPEMYEQARRELAEEAED